MDLEERQTIINKGVWARALKKDPHFITFMEELLEETFAKWHLHTTSPEEREAQHGCLLGFETLETKLTQYEDGLKIAEDDIQNER